MGVREKGEQCLDWLPLTLTDSPGRPGLHPPCSIVSRSDIFKPLFAEAYDLYMEKEVAALSDGSAATAVASSSSAPTAEGAKPKTKKVKKPVEW